MSDIHMILTGGTIEKAYDPVSEKPEFTSKSIIPGYLHDTIKTHMDLSFETICQIDSLQMTEEHRANILRSITHANARHIVIVHGTSTMDVTASYLAQNLIDNNKTIILTGGLIPLKEFAMSDGGFNLGYAMAQAQAQPPGIYIAMHARCFPAGSVRKNIQKARFEEV